MFIFSEIAPKLKFLQSCFFKYFISCQICAQSRVSFLGAAAGLGFESRSSTDSGSNSSNSKVVEIVRPTFRPVLGWSCGESRSWPRLLARVIGLTRGCDLDEVRLNSFSFLLVTNFRWKSRKNGAVVNVGGGRRRPRSTRPPSDPF